jgi:hypothetical protein
MELMGGGRGRGPLSPMSAVTVKGYSRKCTIGYIANTCNKHTNIKYDYIKVFVLGFFFILNSFLAIKPSSCLKFRGFSARELYRPSDHRLSAKLVPTLADRGCRVVSATNPHGR